MEKEFNLSEKIELMDEGDENEEGFIYEKDIKEFIKKLKELSTFELSGVGINDKIIYVKDLDKLAGDKLK